MADVRVEELKPPISEEDFSKYCELMQAVVDRSNGRFTLELLIEDLNANKIRAWVVRDDDGAIRTAGCSRMLIYRSGLRVMRGEWGSGTLDDALGTEPHMLRVARLCRADRIQLEGRGGWHRVLGPEWREVSRVIEREV